MPAFRLAGAAGLIFAVLTATAFVLLRSEPPSGAAGTAGFVTWWSAHAWRFSVGLYLIPFAGMAFLWLLAALRERIGQHEDRFFSTVLLGSGLLYVAMTFAAAASAAAAGAPSDGLLTGGAPDEATFLVGRAISRAFYFVFAIKMAAVFMLVASTIARRTGALPRWFASLGMITGLILLLVVSLNDLVALVFPAWVAILGTLILRAGGDPPRVPPPDAAAGRATTPP